MQKNKLVEIRTTLNLTQIEFAKKLDISQPTLSRFESSNAIPSGAILKKLISIFDINLNWYLNDSGLMFGNITPLTTVDNIPEKYKELLNLLKFAPDSFVDELIKKLKAMKDLQSL